MNTSRKMIKTGARRLHTQAGAVIVTVCLALLFLLGFMGIALDFGHMFVVKTELQTSMDSCALAAAQELDKQPLSIVRARSAGKTAASMNFADFQQDEWVLDDGNFVFRDKNYIETTDGPSAVYVECFFSKNDVSMWLLNALGAVFQNTTDYPDTRTVFASAVASLASGSACPIPVALIPKAGGNETNNYGFTIGEWVKILDTDNNDNPYDHPGEMGWFNINGSQSAKDTKTQLSEGGVCDTEVDDTVELSTPGAKQGVAPQWNGRFGLYRGSDTPATISPDLSGYAYDGTNWTIQRNAWDDFVTKRVTFVPHSGTGTGGFKPTTAANHQQYGYNRRLVTVPVLSPSYTIKDFACMFMLEPMVHPTDPVYLEYRGLASAEGSPCTTNGLAGALAGPKVPVLVR